MKRYMRMAGIGIVVVLAAAAWAAPGSDRPPIMPVSEIREGDKGYGLTVFRGERPERFSIEIIGVRHNALGPGLDMILALADHEVMRDIGILGGLSGSPVFINDRMIGACGYGFEFSKRAIVGITPIEKMLEVYDRTPLEPPPRDIALGPAEDFRLGEAVSLEPKMRLFGGEAVRMARSELPVSAQAFFDPANEEIEFKPLTMPLVVSSCSPQTAQLIEKMFRPLGMEPVFSAISSSAGALDRPSTLALENGSAVGIPFVLGDMTAGGGGTLTYISGGKLIAFAHPAFLRGPSQYPLASARVLTVIPSYQRSTKMLELGGLAGSIHEDRLPGVGGVVGKMPYMVPVTVRLINEGTGKGERTFRYKVMDHRLFAPRWAMTALVESITADEHIEGDLTATLSYRIETDDGRLIEKRTMASGSLSPVALAIGMLADLVPIYSNEFQVASAKSLTAEVRLRSGIQAAELRSAHVDRTIVKPGQTIRVSAYVEPWRKSRQRISTELRIPADLPEGPYNVVVCDAAQRERAEVVRAPGLYQPRNFADLVRVLDIHFRTDRLYVMLTSPDRGMTIDGKEFNSLPPSISFTLDSLQDREKIEPTIGAILAERTVDLPFVLSGSYLTRIEVNRRGGR